MSALEQRLSRDEARMFSCVGAGRDIWNLDRGKTLDQTLTVILGAWGSKSQALDGQIVRGVGMFVNRYDGQIDYSGLTRKLAKYQGGPGALLGYARSQKSNKGGSLGRNVASAIVDLYNKGRRSGGLPPL